MSCGISNQVAEHCNENESLCPECSANMYYDDLHQHILVCVECKHEIDTEEDE
jgi:acetyl-CoA carboxylase beta subunit